MRVAIVNDQLIAVEVLRRVVHSAPTHEIAWIAKDGAEAVQKAQADRPDVILMDLVMPTMDGAEATRRIMQSAACPILVVTNDVARNFSLVCQALGYGAFDAVMTPELTTETPAKAGAELLAKLAKVDGVTRRIKSSASTSASDSMIMKAIHRSASNRVASDSGLRLAAAAAAAERAIASEQFMNAPPVLLIGASTGGPPALEAILSQLSADFPGAIIIAQHIGAEFVGELATWLKDRCPLKVRLALNGDVPEKGTALIANSAQHLQLRKAGTLGYTLDPILCPYKPSVDVLFQSFAQHWATPCVAALLTGMGDDGAQGLLDLRKHGWHTVTQDKESCVVYGMPKAAALIGAASRVIPLRDMPTHFESLIRQMASK